MSFAEGNYAEPFALGVRMADLLLSQFMEEGSPFPYPTLPSEVAAYVDSIVPGAMKDIGTMMANQAGSTLAIQKEALDAIEQGLRARLTESVMTSLG